MSIDKPNFPTNSCSNGNPIFPLEFSRERVKNSTVKTTMVAVSVLSFATLQMGMVFATGAALAGGCAAVTFGCELLRERSVSWLNTKKTASETVKNFAGSIIKGSLIQGIYLKALGIEINQNALVLLREAGRQFLTNPSLLFNAIALMCVIAPIVEEVIFRGFIQERIEDVMNLISHNIYPIAPETVKNITNLAQGVIFGLVHYSSPQGAFNIPIVLMTTLVGIFLGYLKTETGSLSPSIACHSILNTAVAARTLIFDVVL